MKRLLTLLLFAALFVCTVTVSYARGDDGNPGKIPKIELSAISHVPTFEATTAVISFEALAAFNHVVYSPATNEGSLTMPNKDADNNAISYRYLKWRSENNFNFNSTYNLAIPIKDDDPITAYISNNRRSNRWKDLHRRSCLHTHITSPANENEIAQIKPDYTWKDFHRRLC